MQLIRKRLRVWFTGCGRTARRIRRKNIHKEGWLNE